jgi:phage N-6-adenine-methyltransferase
LTFNKNMLSSEDQDWQTPDYVFDFLDKEFDFEGDPCPVFESGKKLFDGLKISWAAGMNFVNPPYSDLEKWIDKGINEQAKKNYSVFLIPSRTDPKWFKKIFLNATEIRFVIGRIHFIPSKKIKNKERNTFGSMIVYFGPKPDFSRIKKGKNKGDLILEEYPKISFIMRDSMKNQK